MYKVTRQVLLKFHKVRLIACSAVTKNLDLCGSSNYLRSTSIFLSKKKLTCFILPLFCFYPQFVVAEEQGDYYWQTVLNGRVLTVPNPGAACDAWLSALRSSDVNGVFDWQMGEMIVDNYPQATCQVTCSSCSRNTSVLALSVSAYTYKLNTPGFDSTSDVCVGNPIDPATGNKFQLEPILQLVSAHPTDFNLIYNSQRPEKWRHSYSQSVVSVLDEQLPVDASFTNPDNLFCGNNTKLMESAGGFGGTEGDIVTGTNSVFAAQAKPDIVQIARATAEQACSANWSTVSRQFHYPWVIGSSATYLGNGRCSIKDSNGVERIKINVYRNPGYVPAREFASSCADIILLSLRNLITLRQSMYVLRAMTEGW